ncbi:MAG TPA: choice-of-anchor D domain-containing protein [Candidatus Saccharimonadales bacterium]|jgi:hypothetical protein|nr:choice-of-anchor D domain-containing protein [Candidatus Saccharimonadales bacterium]
MLLKQFVTFNNRAWFNLKAGTPALYGHMPRSLLVQTLAFAGGVSIIAFMMTGCGGTTSEPSAPPSNPPQASPAHAMATPSSLNFGAQQTGTTSSPVTVTISNIGGQDLVVSGVSPSPGQFVVTDPVPVTVPTGKQIDFHVTFKPTATQPYSGSLRFTTNAAGSTPVALSGTGVSAPGTPPQVNMSPASLAFGAQALNITSVAQAVTVTNTGGSNLLINGVTSAPSQFTVSGPSAATIAPGGNAVYNITFTPQLAQLYSGTLTFNTNASAVSSTVPQVGNGVLGPSSPICGKTDDGLVHPPPSYSCLLAACATNPFPPPNRGSSYVDPQFGCAVTRLTDAVADKLGAAAHHNYGTVSPVNADDSFVMINLENGRKEIVDLSGNIVVPSANMPSTNSQQLPWDISVAARFYYSAGAAILRGDITGLPACASSHNCTLASTALHDFAGVYASVQIPDQEDIADDGDHFWLVGDTSAFLYTISTGEIGAAMNVGTKDSGGGWHKIQIMPSNRMLMTWAVNGPAPMAGQEVYNTDTTLNWHMFDNTIHTDCGKDLTSAEVCVVARIPDTGGGISGAGACPTWTGTQDGGIDVINMASHKPQCLVNVNWLDTEISFRDGNAAGGWVFVTFFKSGNCNSYSCFDTTSPARLDLSWALNWAHFSEEGILVRIDNNNGMNKQRLFHTRSRSTEYYWAIPRGAISRDGKYVVFDSNFDISNSGLANYTDVYAVKAQ